MRVKHKKTIEDVFSSPIKSNLLWTDIEKMLIALKAELSEGRGSRIRVSLNGVRAVFHRPHPRKEADKGAVVSIRRFLKEAGIKNVKV